MNKKIQKSERIVFTEPGVIQCQGYALPALAADQILLQADWSLISAGTELTCLHQRFAADTHWADWVRFPFYPGYSTAGTIIEVGADVTDWSAGERVAWRGKHSRLQIASPNRLCRLSAEVATVDAAWIGLLKIVQVGIRSANLRLGDRVVVVGCGILGQLAIQYCALSGCESVVAVDIDAARLAHASRHGATACVQGSVDEKHPAIIAACAGERPDVVFDVTGSAAVLPACLALARDFGRVVLLGDPGDPNSQNITKDVITRGVRLLGAHDNHANNTATVFGRWTPQAMHRFALQMIATDKIQLGDLVSHTFKPDAAAEAYATAHDPSTPTMGIMFDWRMDTN